MGKITQFALVTSTLLLSSCLYLAKKTHPEPHLETALTGLESPVKIHLDTRGIPHIFAENDDDAAQALGFMHGRDRAFHLELIRLASQGRLAEIFGAELLGVDRKLRILSHQLDESVANLPPADLARAEAYCAGINQGMAQNPRPLEFKILKHEPEDWTPRDIVAVGRLQAWDLSVDASRELVRAQVAAHSPAEAHEWLFRRPHHMGQPIVDAVNTPSDAPGFGPLPPLEAGIPLAGNFGVEWDHAAGLSEPAKTGGIKGESNPSPEARHALALAVADWAESGLGDGNFNPGGSNGIALSGAITADGAAILVGDPHLKFRQPAVFYEAHIQTPEVDYSGATFPGLPMVVIGRAQDIAWTLTTSYADVQDLYRLKIHPENPTQYELDGQWEDLIPWPQTFVVKDESPHEETYYISEFGPIYNPGREAQIVDENVYALAWPGFSPAPLSITTTFDSLYRAKSPQAAIEAIRQLPIPSQNWVFATTGGHIGWVLGGDIPNRRASPLPQDGRYRKNAWTGMISEAKRPVLVDPEVGYIIANNQSILPDTGHYNTYASGVFRALRTHDILTSKGQWTRDEMRALQMDTVNVEAAQSLPLLLPELKSTLSAPIDELALDGPTQKELLLLVEILEAWDFKMEIEAQAPLIWEAWHGEIHRLLFGRWIDDPKALDAFLRSRLSEAPSYDALFSPDDAPYFDDPRTPERETRSGVLTRAFMAAHKQLATSLGQDIQQWTWGSLHTLTLEHPFAKKRVLEPIFGLDSVPLPGGRHCLNALAHDGIVGDYAVTSGPALRQVVSPGVEAGFSLPGGNAGQPKHIYGVNQFEDWAAGRQHAAGGNESEIKAAAIGHITLIPATP